MILRFHVIGPSCAVDAYFTTLNLKKGRMFPFEYWYDTISSDYGTYNITFTRGKQHRSADYVIDGIVFVDCGCCIVPFNSDLPFTIIPLNCADPIAEVLIDHLALFAEEFE